MTPATKNEHRSSLTWWLALIQNPPRLMLIGCVIYLLIEIINLALVPSITAAVRFCITVLLFFFVLKGSRTAGVIWGICNLLGALMAGVFAIIIIIGVTPMVVTLGDTIFTILFPIVPILLAANAAYLFFNKKVRAFQKNAQSS